MANIVIITVLHMTGNLSRADLSQHSDDVLQ